MQDLRGAQTGQTQEQYLDILQQLNRRLDLKCKVHKLRHKLRQMQALEKQQGRVTMTFKQKADFVKYTSGALIQELDALTRLHGFGMLHADGVLLQPKRWQ